MSYLFPEIIGGDDEGVEPGIATTPDSPEEAIVQRVLGERLAGFMDVLQAALEMGLTERGFYTFLGTPIDKLGGATLIEHFTDNEDDGAAQRALEAIADLERRMGPS